MSTPTLYGIKNCDTVKKARKWLDARGVDYEFHDFREDGLTPTQARQWINSLGWEAVLNKRSTTWKQLDAKVREAMDEKTAVATVVEHPTLIKRPLLAIGGDFYVGFKEAEYDKLFQ